LEGICSEIFVIVKDRAAHCPSKGRDNPGGIDRGKKILFQPLKADQLANVIKTAPNSRNQVHQQLVTEQKVNRVHCFRSGLQVEPHGSDSLKPEKEKERELT
jgi:hypothetical protein